VAKTLASARNLVAAQPAASLFATAITQAEVLYGLALATRNVVDFEVSGIRVIDPWHS
jgi:hypothetical protein